MAEFISSRELKTSFEWDTREADTLDELREVISKNDFAHVKRYIITTRVILNPPRDDYEAEESRQFSSISPKIEETEKWLKQWLRDSYPSITVTIQEDDKTPVEVYNHKYSGNLYDIHHEWVKKTFDGVMR